MITVNELMSVNPKTLSRYNSLADARQLMRENRFRHIPIVDETGELIGLVSQRNVLENAISSQTFIDQEELAKIESGILLADVMTSNLTTVSPETQIGDAARIIHQKKYGCLPVVDKNNSLKGIITDHDFVAITIQLLEMMAESEPQEQDY